MQQKSATLLEKAKAFTRKPRIPVTKQESELALAWLKGEINLGQATKAMGRDSGAVLYRFAVCLREEFRAGRIKVAA